MITEGELSALSEKFSIDRYSILREYIQLVFLKYLYSHKAGNDIYFKGGTMIHLLMKSFRFSEDLDFSTTAGIDEAESGVQEVAKRLVAEIPDCRYSTRQRWHDAFTGQISYRTAGLRVPLTVRIEVSGREKPMTRAVTLMETEFPVMPYPLIVHMRWEEVLAEKIRALLVRGKGRDLFDLWFLLSKGITLDKAMTLRKMLFYEKDASPDVIERLRSLIEGLKEEKVVADLRKFVPATHRKWLSQLKQETLKKLP